MMGAPPTIAARRLRLQLEEPVDVADDIGGLTRTWQTRATLWASLDPTRGSERAEAQRTEGVVTHRLILRFRTDVTPAMRLAAGVVTYDIRAVYDPDGRRRDLVLLVEEIQP